MLSAPGSVENSGREAASTASALARAELGRTGAGRAAKQRWRAGGGACPTEHLSWQPGTRLHASARSAGASQLRMSPEAEGTSPGSDHPLAFPWGSPSPRVIVRVPRAASSPVAARRQVYGFVSHPRHRELIPSSPDGAQST